MKFPPFLLPKVVNIYWTLNPIEGSPQHTLAMNEKGAVKLAVSIATPMQRELWAVTFR